MLASALGQVLMTTTPVFRRAPGVRWREFGSDGILLDPASGEYVQINDIGVLIWQSLEQPATLEDVIDRVCEQFTEISAGAGDDIREFVMVLAQRQFLLATPA